MKYLFFGLLPLIYLQNPVKTVSNDLSKSTHHDTMSQKEQMIPAFRLKSPDGKVYTKEILKGKVIVLDFWASWCAPCRKLTGEIDKQIELYHSNPSFQMLGVDYNELDSENAIAYWKSHNYAFPMVSDNDVLGNQLKAGNPTIVVIDKEGKIKGRWDKYAPQAAGEIKKLIDELL